MNIIEFISNNLSTFLALIATGAFAGVLAGLLGVGGGIVAGESATITEET